MELLIYNDFSAFQDNYIKDYELLMDIDFISYLNILESNYLNELRIKENFNPIFTEIGSYKKKDEHLQTINAYRSILIFLKIEINNNVKPFIKKTRLSNPEKIAVLYEIGIETILNKIPIQEDKYRFIHELIGGNYDNIKKYMMNGLTNDNHLKAKDFINSKTI